MYFTLPYYGIIFFVYFCYFVPFFAVFVFRFFLKLSILFHGWGTKARDFARSTFLVLLSARCVLFLFGSCALSVVPPGLRPFVAWRDVRSGSTASKVRS